LTSAGATVAIIAAVAAAPPSTPRPIDHDCFYNVDKIGVADVASADAVLEADAKAVQRV
jgi:hypothetical protein